MEDMINTLADPAITDMATAMHQVADMPFAAARLCFQKRARASPGESLHLKVALVHMAVKALQSDSQDAHIIRMTRRDPWNIVREANSILQKKQNHAE